MGPRLPNLFIIGAPKCGTTSLYAYLRQHPQIFLSEPKEPNHFAYSAGNPYGWPSSNPLSNLDAYLALFQDTDAPVVGEASTCYCLMPHVPVAIRKHNPNAKIVAILREPVDRAWSMYLYWQQHDKNCRQISLKDFRQRFLADDLMTEHERQHNLRVRWLRAAGMYWQNLRHFYREFPGENIFLIQYDEFASQPQQCLSKLCRFLDVDDFAFDTSWRENRTCVPRFRRLYNLINLDTEHAMRRWLKRAIGGVASHWKQAVNRALFSSELRPKLPPALVVELSKHYRDDLKKLRDATGFSVNAWLEPTQRVE